MHFTAKSKEANGKVSLDWCKVGFKSDFIRLLKAEGTIPKQNTAEVIKLMRQNDESESKIRKLQKSLKE